MKKLIGMLLAMGVLGLGLFYVAPMFVQQPALKPVTALVQNIMEQRPGQTDLVVQSNTLVIKKNQYQCGDAEIYYRGAAPQELIGLNQARINMLYPQEKGWQVTFTADELAITQHASGLCGLHRQYRHWGLHDDMLAIYQGPLGYDDVLMRVEKNIAVASLPEGLLKQLRQVAYFNALTPEEQLGLQNVLEFKSEWEMNEAMENLDEHSSYEF